MHPRRSATPWSFRIPFKRTCVVAPLVFLVMPACGSRPRPEPDLTDPVALAAAQAAMLPTRLNIHPLTHIGLDAAGRPVLLLYVELRDQFDENTRALGNLRVSIHPAGLDPISGAGDPANGLDRTPSTLSWDIDLRDPDRNALLYDDLVTRTYALTLTGLPGWLADASTGRSTAPGSANGAAGATGAGVEGAGGAGGAGGEGSGGGEGLGGAGPTVGRASDIAIASAVVSVSFRFPDPRNPGGPGSTISDSRRLGR